MSKNVPIYYGEIVAHIAVKLSATVDRSNNTLFSSNKDMQMADNLSEISAEAGRIFDALEDLSGEHFIDWRQALNHYGVILSEALNRGRSPTLIDFISMAARSMELSRSV